MERIAKNILFVIGTIFIIIVLLFVVCWHFDGFEAAWAVFFGSNILSPLFEFMGVYDWLKGMFLALVIAVIVEAIVGHRIKRRAVGIIVDIASAIITLISYIILTT